MRPATLSNDPALTYRFCGHSAARAVERLGHPSEWALARIAEGRTLRLGQYPSTIGRRDRSGRLLFDEVHNQYALVIISEHTRTIVTILDEAMAMTTIWGHEITESAKEKARGLALGLMDDGLRKLQRNLMTNPEVLVKIFVRTYRPGWSQCSQLLGKIMIGPDRIPENRDQFVLHKAEAVEIARTIQAAIQSGQMLPYGQVYVEPHNGKKVRTIRRLLTTSNFPMLGSLEEAESIRRWGQMDDGQLSPILDGDAPGLQGFLNSNRPRDQAHNVE